MAKMIFPRDSKNGSTSSPQAGVMKAVQQNEKGPKAGVLKSARDKK